MLPDKLCHSNSWLVYKSISTHYNTGIMNSKEDGQLEHKPGSLNRLMVYLPDRTAQALEAYLKDRFPPKSRVKTAVVVMALNAFLEKENFLSGKEVTSVAFSPSKQE